MEKVMTSAKSQISSWVRESVEGKEEIELPHLVNQAVDHFSTDQEFILQLFRETMRETVYEIARRVLEQSRQFVLAGDKAFTKEGLTKRVKRHSIFATWLEHVGDRHIRVMEMTREDLLAAAKEREDRGNHEINLARLWRSLADQLEGGQRVSTKFTPEEIERMYQQN